MVSQRLAVDWEVVLDMSPIPTAMTDAEGGIIFVNQAVCHLLEKLYGREFSKEDRVGKPILSFVPEADRGAWEKRYRDLLRGIPFRLPEYPDANIQGVVWEIWGNPIRDASGRIIGSVVMGQDVTERVTARKDAQKRVALDRVRAQVYGMQREEDIENVFRALFEEMKRIGTEFDDCSIHIMDPSRGTYRYYFMSSDGKFVFEKDKSLSLAGKASMESWREKKVVYRLDIHRSDLYGSRKRIQEISGKPIRSVLDIPLADGTMGVNSVHPHHFSEEDIARLKEFAGVISEGLVRLRDLRKLEVRNRELSVINAISRVPDQSVRGDAVVRQTLGRVMRVIGVSAGAIYLLDESRARFSLRAARGFPETLLRSIEVRNGDGDPVFVSALEPEAPLIVSDPFVLREWSGYEISLGRSGPIIVVPLSYRKRRVGVMVIQSQEPEAPSDEELRLFRLIGTIIGMTVENARLYEQVERNLDQLFSLHQAGRTMVSSLNLDDVLRSTLDAVTRLLNVDACVISAANGPSSELRILAHRGERGWARWRAMASAKLQNVYAAHMEGAFEYTVGDPEDGTVRILCAPLMARSGPVGLLEVYLSGSSTLSPGENELLAALAALAAPSIENARLYAMLEAKEAELERLVSALINAHEEERRMVAYDIHDGLAQLVMSADMHMEAFGALQSKLSRPAKEELEKGLSRLKEAVEEARSLVSELRPPGLDDFGLVTALHHCLREFRQETGWEVVFEENLRGLRLPYEIEITTFRIVQEALNNAKRHADTPKIELSIQRKDGTLSVSVRDWGRGFDPEEMKGEKEAGLAGMKERARLLKGRCTVESHPGEGTAVRLTLPLNPDTTEQEDGTNTA